MIETFSGFFSKASWFRSCSYGVCWESSWELRGMESNISQYLIWFDAFIPGSSPQQQLPKHWVHKLRVVLHGRLASHNSRWVYFFVFVLPLQKMEIPPSVSKSTAYMTAEDFTDTVGDGLSFKKGEKAEVSAWTESLGLFHYQTKISKTTQKKLK